MVLTYNYESWRMSLLGRLNATRKVKYWAMEFLTAWVGIFYKGMSYRVSCLPIKWVEYQVAWVPDYSNGPRAEWDDSPMPECPST